MIIIIVICFIVYNTVFLIYMHVFFPLLLISRYTRLVSQCLSALQEVYRAFIFLILVIYLDLVD